MWQAAPSEQVRGERMSQAVDEAPRERTAATRRVLLVDGDHSWRELRATILRLEGHDVVCAGSAAEALGLLVRTRPEVVLVGLDLPDRSGLELPPLLRGAADGLRLVAMTWNEVGTADPRALAAGFDDCIPRRPILLSELRRVIG